MQHFRVGRNTKEYLLQARVLSCLNDSIVWFTAVCAAHISTLHCVFQAWIISRVVAMLNRGILSVQFVRCM